MKANEMDMTEGSLFKKIWLYSLPLMASNLLQVLFNLADVAVVGRFAGNIALGAVGSTSILITLAISIPLGISGGINSVTALYAGAKETDNERKTVHTSLLLSLMFGLGLLLIGVGLTRPILKLINTKPELIDGAETYLRIYMLGAPAVAIYNYGNAVLSAIGDTKRPLLYLVISGIINVILNLVLVIAFKMDVAGVALASVISQYISAALILIFMFRCKEDYGLSFRDIKLDYKLARKILIIGIPAAIQYSLFAVANLYIQRAINSFDHIVVEGNAAAMNADGIVYDMMAAFYMASTSFIAQNLGAHKAKRIKQTYLITTLYSFVIGALLGGLLVIYKGPFLALFTDNAEVIRYGKVRLSIMGLSYCISAFMDNATAAARGLGKSVVPTVAVILGTVVFRIVWISTVFQHFRTLESIYILYACAWVFTAIFENIYFFAVYRKKL